jgi:LmbE family N-acetylglucosaminyl deacetylase/ActR/RegA family two-component response regulator
MNPILQFDGALPSIFPGTPSLLPVKERGRLLLVEDHAEQSRLLERWFNALGFQVVVESDGLAGMSRAREPNFDLLVTDIELPGASGLEVARVSKEAMPHRPVVVMTAHASVDYAVQALRSNVDEFLRKPLSRPETCRSIIQLWNHRVKATVQTVLAIGAHPDDVEIGVGGTLLKHREAGDRVVILTLSRGARGGAADLREDESMQVAQAMGATLVMGDLIDTAISEGFETIDTIAKVIAEYKPSRVYTHCERETHQDHRSAFRATMVAARGVSDLFCYQSPSTTVDFHPTRFVEISDYLEQKYSLIQLYKTQVGARPYLAKEIVDATARYWARFCGYGAVEPLEVIRSA